VAPIEELRDEKWEAILAINLSSACRLIKAVVPEMKACKCETASSTSPRRTV
jgi:3-hydroxybutyrate dehydrogenase